MPKTKQVDAALASLKRSATKHDKANLTKFGITTAKAYGVSMANMQVLAKRLGADHDLAAGLWASGWYEARMLATLVDDPARVTAAQMERWCRDFDNWAICDTACFKLFDRTPHAWSKVTKWSGRRDEFGKRAAFALLASLALHLDATTPDALFVESLGLIEGGATDERNFVKKAVSWALRAIGGRNHALHGSASRLAASLAGSADVTSRWIGKDALRELSKPAVLRRLERVARR